MDVHRAYGILLRGFRRRRMRAFQRSFGDREATTILDVGGTPFNWPAGAPGGLLSPQVVAEPTVSVEYGGGGRDGE